MRLQWKVSVACSKAKEGWTHSDTDTLTCNVLYARYESAVKLMHGAGNFEKATRCDVRRKHLQYGRNWKIADPRPSTKKAPAKGRFHYHWLNKCPTPPRMSVCMHGTCEAQPTTSTRYRRVVPQKYHCGRPKETKYPPSRIQKAPHGPLSWRQLTSLAPFFLAPECFSPPSRPVPAGLKKMRGAARCAPVKPPRAGPLRLFL